MGSFDFNGWLSGGSRGSGSDNSDKQNDTSADDKKGTFLGSSKKSRLILIAVLLIACLFTLDPKNQTISQYAYCDGSTLTFFVTAADAEKIIPGETAVEVGSYKGIVSTVSDAPLTLEQVAALFPETDVVSVFDLTNSNYQITVQTGDALEEGIHSVVLRPALAAS